MHGTWTDNTSVCDNCEGRVAETFRYHGLQVCDICLEYLEDLRLEEEADEAFEELSRRFSRR